MNIKVFITLLVLMMVLGSAAFAQNKKSSKSEKETALFEVSMTCENCKKRIEKNISYEKGVTDLQVDLPHKTVKVEYKKDKTSAEKLMAAIEKLGYDVTILNDKNKTK